MKNQMHKFTKKRVREIFDITLESIKQSIGILYASAFYLKIKPLADRYGWTIEWGMGSVSFTTKDGRDLYPNDPISGTKALDKMERELEDMFEGFPIDEHNGILWEVMCGLGAYNKYHKDTGLQLIRRGQ